jgi:hypothetical protein
MSFYSCYQEKSDSSYIQLNDIYGSAFEYTVLFVLPSSTYTNISGFPTREYATHSCENHEFSKFSPHTCNNYN